MWANNLVMCCYPLLVTPIHIYIFCNISELNIGYICLYYDMMHCKQHQMF